MPSRAPMPSPTEIDGRLARAALRHRTEETARLLRTISDPSVKTAGLDWTLGETAAHILIAARAYSDSVSGRLEPWLGSIPDDAPGYRERMWAMTSRTLESEPDRDPVSLAVRVTDAVNSFLDASAGLPGTETISTPWYQVNAELSIDAATCLLLGEQVIHSRDIATTIGAPWRTAKSEVLLMIHALVSMMPIAVNREATQDLDCTFGIHLRGGPVFAVHVNRGMATIEPIGSCRVDCHLSADPEAFVLVGYGRISQWNGIGRGKLISWGRRPWLALRFKGYFFNP